MHGSDILLALLAEFRLTAAGLDQVEALATEPVAQRLPVRHQRLREA